MGWGTLGMGGEARETAPGILATTFLPLASRATTEGGRGSGAGEAEGPRSYTGFTVILSPLLSCAELGRLQV